MALYLLLSLNSLGITMAGRIIPPSAPSTVTRPLVSSEVETYVKPQLGHKQKVFQVREVKGCLPKGFRHNSAPSRFVNYKPLDSSGCSGMHSEKKPWWCFLNGRGFVDCIWFFKFTSSLQDEKIVYVFYVGYCDWYIVTYNFERRAWQGERVSEHFLFLYV